MNLDFTFNIYYMSIGLKMTLSPKNFTVSVLKGVAIKMRSMMGNGERR